MIMKRKTNILDMNLKGFNSNSNFAFCKNLNFLSDSKNKI